MRRWLLSSVLLLAWTLALYGLSPPAEESLRPALMEVKGESGELVLDLDEQADLEAFAQKHQLQLQQRSGDDPQIHVVQVDNLKLWVERLREDPAVHHVEPQITLGLLEYPNDPLWSEQWNMRDLGVERGWRAGGGRGVRVAVLDTGVSPVPDLEGSRLLEGISLVEGIESSEDDHGHGTHVAGTIAQTTHNGLGVVGVSPEVELLPVKVLGSDGRSSSDQVARAIYAAARAGADVINLSLGGGDSEIVRAAVRWASRRGVLVVAAAGNTGTTGLGSPANAPEAIAVGALGPSGERTHYSTMGPELTLMAPGGDLLLGESSGIQQDTVDGKGGSRIASLQGTSMASPHVAGAAAVLAGMGLDDEAVRALLIETAEDLDEAGRDDRTGYGRVDLDAAIASAVWKWRAQPALIAGGMALLLGGLAGATWSWTASSALLSLLGAGGLFFLPFVSLEPSLLVTLSGQSIISWPGVLLGRSWTHFPLWISALPPAVLVLSLGLTRRGSVLAMAACLVWAVHLLTASSSGSLDPWFLGWGLDKLWLTLNGTASLLGAMAVSGGVRMRRKHDAGG